MNLDPNRVAYTMVVAFGMTIIAIMGIIAALVFGNLTR